MKLKEYLNKDNLHHAYLIEGMREEVAPEILKFVKSLGMKTENNADFVQIRADTFKIDDARNLKIYAQSSSDMKVFLIFANNFLIEAQNSMLKLFEEPIENTYFFVIAPDASVFLKTLLSRFYFISTKSDTASELKEVEKFIKLTPSARINFIKELLTVEEEDDEGNEIVVLNSARAKALKFLNALESTLHKQISKETLDTNIFKHMFKVRQFLRMPGSSPKTLMESVALIVPKF